MSAQLTVARIIHERKLLELVASPEPEDKFEAAMRRGSIEYRKSALRAIERLLDGEIKRTKGSLAACTK